MLKKFLLFKNINCGLLLLRIAIGLVMLLSHGLGKLESFGGKYHTFADPVGMGHELSYTLVVFAEFFCSLFLVFGLFTRIALIPLLINMLVIVFVVFASEPWQKKEAASIYLIIYLTLFLAGPGKYSLDNWWLEKR